MSEYTTMDLVNMIEQEKANNIVPENIKAGATIFDVVGTFSEPSVCKPTYISYLNSDNSISNLDRYDVANIQLHESINSLDFLFNSMYNLDNLDNISHWNASHINTMSWTFGYCYHLPELNLSEWNASNVERMDSTFLQVSAATDINLSNWNINKNVNMLSCFHGCSALKNLDLTNFIANGSITNISGIFQECYNLKNLNGINSWNISGANDLGYAFHRCSNLNNLDGLENWDVSNITQMYDTFSYCSNLCSLEKLSNWDVSNVTLMHCTFHCCSNLESLNGLENWDVSNVTNMYGMFGVDYWGDYSYNLRNISALSNWNTSNVVNMDSMFFGCHVINNVEPIFNWDVSNVIFFNNMFGGREGSGLYSPKSNLDFSNWNINDTSYFDNMFYHATVNSINGLNFKKTTNYNRLFAEGTANYYSNIIIKDVPGTRISGVFYNIRSFYGVYDCTIENIDRGDLYSMNSEHAWRPISENFEMINVKLYNSILPEFKILVNVKNDIIVNNLNAIDVSRVPNFGINYSVSNANVRIEDCYYKNIETMSGYTEGSNSTDLYINNTIFDNVHTLNFRSYSTKLFLNNVQFINNCNLYWFCGEYDVRLRDVEINNVFIDENVDLAQMFFRLSSYITNESLENIGWMFANSNINPNFMNLYNDNSNSPFYECSKYINSSTVSSNLINALTDKGFSIPS